MRLTRPVYRAHHPRWSFAPDSGQGAAITGGRFNPVGMPALYTALRFETAWSEAQQAFPFKAQPLTLCAYDVDCDDVLDLTDTEICSRYSIAQTDLACAWREFRTLGTKPPSWLLAERLSGAGIAGIVVPSFAGGATVADVNAVFRNWTSAPPHQARVIDDERRLPKDALSWQ